MNSFSIRITGVCVMLQLVSAITLANDSEVFFESQVRPLLAKHCFECHGEKKQESSVRLDHRSLVLEPSGGNVMVVAGKPDESRLWQVIKYDDNDVQMPPAGKLSDEEQAILKTWIESGAYWPEEALPAGGLKMGIPKNADGTINFIEAVQQHWAYLPIQNPPVPTPARPELYPSTIDKFVSVPLDAAGLSFSEPASRQVLIRRLKENLHGVPPTIEEVREFENDQDPQAVEKLVDRLLADPMYGERWGRHWLDLARYADTKGYVFTSNKNYPFAYTYRDFVVNALNSDMPYNEFVKLQIAADTMGLPEGDPKLAAMGFLTVGPRFLFRIEDIIDDRIDVVTRGLMGMTVACARCHDHKYDPIPTADYYSLFGVFQSSHEPEPLPRLSGVDETTPQFQAYQVERDKRKQAITDYVHQQHHELLNRAIDQLVDYVPSAAVQLKLIPEETDLGLVHGAPRKRLINRWAEVIQRQLNENKPVFLAWQKLMALTDEEIAQADHPVWSQIDEQAEIPSLIKEEFRANPPKSRLEVARAYGRLLERAVTAWKEGQKQDPPIAALDNGDLELIRQVIYGPASLTDLPVQEGSPLFETDQRNHLATLNAAVAEWDVVSPDSPPRAMVMLDNATPTKPVIYIRGNPGRRGDEVDRHAPRILEPHESVPFQNGSGRAELAERIVAEDNPLTARVIVNRVWAWHFGTPIVATQSDFGTRAEPPLNPELLDYLAWSFVHEDNWSLKSLHRRILLSNVYLQSSADRPDARNIDPENQLLWRQNRLRLNFEAMRDSMLFVSGHFDGKLGGQAFDIENATDSPRRTLYAKIDRNNLPGLLRTFDYPAPDTSSPGRPQTVVPQQALFAMNSSFSMSVSQKLADLVRNQTSDLREQSRILIERIYSREATVEELDSLSTFLTKHPLEDLIQALFMTNEFMVVD
ncbi:PSD1 and planctomycete cytochrome C domain-containing protein [Planctomicrobium sp. SH668]|uniref:PSD1 and planctomycete cytochrome C domain-containing protein n=1 Tax=Planctomicrobium sp. SH668 TaxID=3448126 RepID=UPI003F5C2893